MKLEISRLYISRKRGKGMTLRYKISALLPLLVLFSVTAALSFAITFIYSVSERIDRMIALMGSGTILSLSDPSAYIGEDAECSCVRYSNALLYSENGESALFVKGVEDSYFLGFRSDEIEMERLDTSVMNPVILSSSLAAELSLSPGDRMTILIWEDGRARPYLCTLSGIFSSVYPQLDSYLAYLPIDLVSSSLSYEILLPDGEDPGELLRVLHSNGIPAESYMTMYSSLYSNVRSSLSTLYLILASVALLAAFFSSDAAEAYIDRDRSDIKTLWILGLSVSQIRNIYFRITLLSVFSALLAGTVLGLGLSALSPFILKAVAYSVPALLEYYVTSFSISVPLLPLLAMMLLSLAVSAFSVALSLRKIGS